MKKALSLFLVLVFAVGVFSACSENKSESKGISGTWKCDADLDSVIIKGTYVFNEDGTGTAPKTDTSEFAWSVYDGKIYVERKDVSPHYYEFKLKDNTMILVSADGKEAVFTKE